MRIYVAHTYGRRHGATPEECEANAQRAIEIGRQLILKGHNPFIPNLFHYVHKGWDLSPDETLYFTLVSDWIEFCHALLVGQMPKWENSGVIREVNIALSLGKQVYYDLSEVP